MYHFDFYMPAKVLFGEGRLQSLHEEKLPRKKALIATTNGKSVKKYGYLAALEKELDTAGVAYELFDQIRPNPTSDNVMDGAALAKKTGCDFAIAHGLLQVHCSHDDKRWRYLGLQPFRQWRQKTAGP